MSPRTKFSGNQSRGHSVQHKTRIVSRLLWRHSKRASRRGTIKLEQEAKQAPLGHYKHPQKKEGEEEDDHDNRRSPKKRRRMETVLKNKFPAKALHRRTWICYEKKRRSAAMPDVTRALWRGLPRGEAPLSNCKTKLIVKSRNKMHAKGKMFRWMIAY